jgi:hypothetical protein
MALGALLKIAIHLLADMLRFVILLFRTTQSIQTENLSLRRQLVLFIEHGVQPRRMDAATRVSLAICTARIIADHSRGIGRRQRFYPRCRRANAG